MSEREVTVSGFVPRHQVRQYLRVSGIEWVEHDEPGDAVKFTFTATDEQWSGVSEWVKKVQQ